jgi:hypothetical protein
LPENLAKSWYEAFMETVRRPESAEPLRAAALDERLAAWTEEMTRVVVSTCVALGWQASAKGHQLELLPETRSEYLALDVMAFPDGEKRWRFPAAIMELENSKDDDRVAYSLWKVLCVRADLRAVFCYRRSPEEGAALVRFLRDEVVHAMALAGRVELEGETLLVVGCKNESSTFPYGFFKWWWLETNTGTFRLM